MVYWNEYLEHTISSTISSIDGPAIKGCTDAVESLLCYETWIMENKPVREVIAATTQSN
jgi:hypothetical protein